jgi:hypothetical protein
VVNWLKKLWRGDVTAAACSAMGARFWAKFAREKALFIGEIPSTCSQGGLQLNPN